MFSSKASAESGGFYTSGYCGVKCDEYPNGENISWSITDDGVLTITGVGKMAEECFSNDLRIKKVIIEDGVENISVNAFAQCASLLEVQAANSVKIIEERGFFYCGNLVDISFPGVETIGLQSFFECDSLTVCDFPKAEIVCDQAFDYCDNITTINMDNVKSIGMQGFDCCSNIANVSMKSVKTIGFCAFYLCREISEINFPNVEVVESHAFYLCQGLSSINCPKLKRIDNLAFSYTNFENLVLPDSVEYIGSQAFASMDSLKSVTIGKNVAHIDPSAFYNESYISQFKSFTVSEENEYYSSYNGVLYNKNQTEIVSVPNAIEGALILSPYLESFSFASCDTARYITRVEIDNSNEFFSTENGLLYSKDKKELIFCARGYESTDIINIDNNTEIVLNSAFKRCEHINKITMPRVKYIQEAAFESSSISIVNAPCLETIDFCGFAFSGLNNITLENCKFIGEYAFWGCNLSNVTMNNVETIGYGAFKLCKFIEITLPDSLTSMSFGAFSSCENLESVYIGSGLEYLWPDTFENSNKLSRVNISSNNPYMQSKDGIVYKGSGTDLYLVPNAYKGTIYLPDTLSEFTDVVSGNVNIEALSISDNSPYFSTENGILYSKDKTIEYCVPSGYLGDVTLNENTKTVKRISGCNNVIKIVMPSVTKIEWEAISSNESLEEIEIPQIKELTVSSISYCPNLKRLYIPSIENIEAEAVHDVGLEEFKYPEKSQLFGQDNMSNLKLLQVDNRYAQYENSFDSKNLAHADGCVIRGYCGSPAHILAIKQLLDFESLGHTYLDWYTVTPATYENEGVERRNCAYCDGYDERTIPKLEQESYTATFIAEGKTVGIVEFAKNTTTIEEPAVPAKDRYNGEWEAYTLSNADITINAKYTLIGKDNASEIETESEAIHYTYDDDVLFKLKAWSKAKTIKSIVSESIPLDIVLVVDQSGSMDNTLGGNVKKVTALKNAANEFINTVYENSQLTGADHRISVVGFGLSGYSSGYQYNENTELLTSNRGVVNYSNIKNTDYASSLMSVNESGKLNTKLTTAVSNIAARGATAADLGLEMAKSVFANTDSEGRQRVVIFMTDGEPTHSSGFENEVANAAIYNSKILKNEYSATVYSVGVFNQKTLRDSKIDTFMNAVSSNYPKAESMMNKGDATDNTYYCTVSNTDRLSEVFQTITTETLSHTAPFDDLTIIKTLSKYVTLTSQQEEQLRLDVVRRYGISNEDIIITRNENGTTTIRINGLKPEEITVDDEVRYEISIEFFASLNENAAAAGTYVVDDEDSGVMLGGNELGYEATFDTNSITTTEGKTRVIFTINGEVYEISENVVDGVAERPEFDVKEGWTFSGWSVDSVTAVNGTIFDATLIKSKYTVNWITANKTITQTYEYGDFIVAPEVDIDTASGTFLSWNTSIPTTMPANNLEFTAVYGGHVHRYTSEITKKMKCDKDGEIKYTCSCGDTYTETVPKCGHDFAAVTSNTGKKDGRCTFVCVNCGKKYPYGLSYQVTESERSHSHVSYEFNLTNSDMESGFEPDEYIVIRIPLTDKQITTQNVTVYRKASNGNKVKLDARIENGFLVISTNHFSPYEIDFGCSEYGNHKDTNSDGICDECEKEVSFIAVDSTDGNGHTVSTMEGGLYANGDTAILVAEKEEGYKFDGWYDYEDEDYSNCLCGNLTYEFEANGEAHYVAKYTANGSAQITVSTLNNGSGYTVGDDSTVQSGNTITANVGSTLVLKAVNGSEVYRWQNANGKVLGTGNTLNYYVTGNENITLVYKSNTANQSFVEFVNYSGQVLSYGQCSEAENLSYPTPPTKTGYTFKYWTLDGATKAESAAINTLIQSGENKMITLRPYYEKKETKYDLTVYVNGTLSDTLSGEFSEGEAITVRAPEVEDKEFQYWTDGSGKVLGYTEEYFLQLTTDTVIKAEYSDEKAEAEPILVISKLGIVTDGEIHKVTCAATRNVPEGYTVVEQGFLYGKNLTNVTESTMVYGSSTVSKYAAKSTENTGVVTLNVKVSDDDMVVTYRAYMVIRDEATGNESVYYSEIAQRSYNAAE